MKEIENAIAGLNSRGLAIVQDMFLAFLVSLIRPIATVTEKLYRRQMGERYFTRWNVFIGVPLIIAACLPLSILRGRGLDWMEWSITDWVSVTIGCVWLAVFVWESVAHFRDVRRRYRENVLWHSYCYGVGFDKRPSDIAACCVIAGIAAGWFHLYGIMLLLVFSGGFSVQMRAFEMMKMRKAYLDTIDGKIEQWCFAEAVRNRLTPGQAIGLVAPLPAYIPDESRDRFVRARGFAKEEKTTQVAGRRTGGQVGTQAVKGVNNAGS